MSRIVDLKMNKAKYIFRQKKLSFFGIDISESGINADPNKTDSLHFKSWQTDSWYCALMF